MSCPTEDLAKNINEVAEKFSEAEQAIKKIELSDAQAEHIPSINQLRYAGSHLLKALTNQKLNDGEKLDEVKLSLNHCKRALYDTYEFGVIDCLERIKAFNDDYKDVCISEVIPDIAKYRLKVNEVIDRIAAMKFNKEDRHNHYLQCSDDFVELKKIKDLLEISRSDLNSKIRNYNALLRQNRILICIAIIAILIALITGFKTEILKMVGYHNTPAVEQDYSDAKNQKK